MEQLFHIDWRALFIPSVPVAEIFLRGTLVYLLLFLFMRFLLKREAGVLGIADLLLVVLIANAAQNAMTNDYKSITDGTLLVVTIIFWNYALDWLAHRSPRFERVVRPAPLPLIKGWRMLRRNMRQEMIAEEELMSQLREQGVGNVSEVKSACMEGDGRISVVRGQ
jgi:uncharacterized membrane protein YcaP (DUF421 family)